MGGAIISICMSVGPAYWHVYGLTAKRRKICAFPFMDRRYAIRIGNTFVAVGFSVTTANRIILLCANFGDGGANARGIGRAAEIADCSTAKLTGFTDVCTAADLPDAAIAGLLGRITRGKIRRGEVRLVFILRHSARCRASYQTR